MDQELDVYKLGALAKDYRFSVRALERKRKQIEELNASKDDAEKALIRLEEAQTRAEKALWAYLRDI